VDKGGFKQKIYSVAIHAIASTLILFVIQTNPIAIRWINSTRDCSLCININLKKKKHVKAFKQNNYIQSCKQGTAYNDLMTESSFASSCCNKN